METPDNKVEVENEIVPGVTLGELKQIHSQFNVVRCQGEFTITEYMRAIGVNYYIAQKELQEATDAGRIIKRTIGKRAYYGLVKPIPEIE